MFLRKYIRRCPIDSGYIFGAKGWLIFFRISIIGSKHDKSLLFIKLTCCFERFKSWKENDYPLVQKIQPEPRSIYADTREAEAMDIYWEVLLGRYTNTIYIYSTKKLGHRLSAHLWLQFLGIQDSTHVRATEPRATHCVILPAMVVNR